MPGATMHALTFLKPSLTTDSTVITELPVPKPGPGQIAIDVRYAGVNFVDIMMRRGDPGYVTGWPFVPGVEAAGTVRALGDGVVGFTIGQRVVAITGSGGYAPVAVADAALTVPVPDGLDLATAATAPAAATTALLMLTGPGCLAPGQTVLTHSAAGGVGQAVVQLAKRLGSGLVVGTVSNPERIDSALAAGYDLAFVRDADLPSRVRQHTGPRGVDLILDPLGTTMIDVDLSLAAPGGRIVLFGNPGGTEQSPLPSFERLFVTNTSIASFNLMMLSKVAPERVRQGVERVLAYLISKEIHTSVEVLGDLAQLPAAHNALAERRGNTKYVVQVQEQGAVDGDRL